MVIKIGSKEYRVREAKTD
jgi:uncharacterized protein